MGVAPPPTRCEELAEFLRHRTAPGALGLEGGSGRPRTSRRRRDDLFDLTGIAGD